ncbi:hypothetical protein CHL78_001265 [Romboutsia weinsteinii]|uniref:Uncharacterized protein n=1 Tax=Romboutsia weinsteinii TaxID=2020949 RepID=A0A371J9J8_9FIRM|nr:hypothetical protein [Romboutsia weinsteinii]RDY29357.1 hypothetical protein CHL78_001265 [Romboutsia weinsteinii]
MATKLKNYSGKFFKNKSLVFNCLFILAMFMITQALGILICFHVLEFDLFMILVVLFSLNFILYKTVLS